MKKVTNDDICFDTMRNKLFNNKNNDIIDSIQETSEIIKLKELITNIPKLDSEALRKKMIARYLEISKAKNNNEKHEKYEELKEEYSENSINESNDELGILLNFYIFDGSDGPKTEDIIQVLYDCFNSQLKQQTIKFLRHGCIMNHETLQKMRQQCMYYFLKTKGLTEREITKVTDVGKVKKNIYLFFFLFCGLRIFQKKIELLIFYKNHTAAHVHISFCDL